VMTVCWGKLGTKIRRLPAARPTRRTRDSTRYLRHAGAILLGLSLVGPGTAAFAQPDENKGSDGSHSAFDLFEPDHGWGKAFGLSLGILEPMGHYRSDHEDSMARGGVSLLVGLRRNDKKWAIYPNITLLEVTSRPTVARDTNLKHETTTFGADVHWRGSNPGMSYFVFGGGIAEVELIATGGYCVGFPIIGIGGCTSTDKTVGDKTAPYVQVGFGLEGMEGFGHYFIELLWWWGPYLRPMVSSDGSLQGAHASTGNALRLQVGVRWY